jgi:hypothetical protein
MASFLKMAQTMDKLAAYSIWFFCFGDIAVSIAYAVAGDWRKAIYWLACGTICATVSK